MNMRDNMRGIMGASSLPTLILSSQPRDLVEWLLMAQTIMTTAVPPPPEQPMDIGDDFPAETGQSAYEDTLAAGLAVAKRNASSFSFGDDGISHPPPSRSGRGEAASAGGGAYALTSNPITGGSFGDDGISHPPPSRSGRGAAASAGGGAYALTSNPITGGGSAWDETSRPGSRGGGRAVVVQAGRNAYSTGNNPILGGATWDEAPSMRVTPRSMGGRGAVAEAPRPTTAGSMASLASDQSSRQAHEDSAAGAHTNRMRNQGSFAFG